MKRLLTWAVPLLLTLGALAWAQPSPQVSVVGAVTNGNCARFSSTLQLSDSGVGCGVTGTLALPLNIGNPAVQDQLQITSSSGGMQLVVAAGIDANAFLNVGARGGGTVNIIDGNGVAAEFFVPASAVNFWDIDGNVTGAPPVIASTGSDTNVGAFLQTKGTGNISFASNNGVTTLFQIVGSTTAVNSMFVTAGNTGSGPVITMTGSDTNIGLTLTPKGTGGVVINPTAAPGILVLNGNTSGSASLTTTSTGGHFNITSTGTTPTLTAGCNGTGQVISGNDTHATIIGQTTASTTCSLQFGTAYANPPDCTITGLSSPLTGAVTIATTGLIINFASTANYKWTYHCVGA